LYFETKEERDRWHALINKVNNPFGNFEDNYQPTGTHLGHGAFGGLEKYICKRSGQPVAVKVLNKFIDGMAAKFDLVD
jgi:hypothetical protein